MPLASEAVTLGIVSAAAGLLGVMIGAVLGGFIDWRLEKSREKAQARAAARLLRADLSIATERLDAAIGELLWWRFYELKMEPWTQHRDLLAAVLSADDWQVVSQAAIELQYFGRQMAAVPEQPEPLTITIYPGAIALTRKSAESLIETRQNAVDAFNALSAAADDGETLAPGDPPKPGSRPYRPPSQGGSAP